MKERRDSRFTFVKNTVKDFPKVTRTQFLRRNTRFSGDFRVIQNIFTPISSRIEEVLVVRRVEFENKPTEFYDIPPKTSSAFL